MREWIFGADATCDLRVTSDPYVSGRHCRITSNLDLTVIEDLGTTNGTWIRYGGEPHPYGQRVLRPTVIEPGVVIRIGHTDIPWTER